MYEIDALYTFVAGLSVNGVSIRNLSGVVIDPDGRAAIFQPDLTAPVTTEAIIRDSYGAGGSGRESFVHHVPYALIMAKAGSERSLGVSLPRTLALVKALVEEIDSHDFDAGGVLVDIQIETVYLNGLVVAPNGAQCEGARIVLRVQELAH